MMRYQLLRRGVYDRDNDRRVRPDMPEWADYEAWLALGNTPDPIRYHLLPVGVFNRDTGRPVLPGTPEWDTEWLPWFGDGEYADPEPVRVPTADELAEAVDLAARKAMREELRADNTLQFLRTHTPAEAEAWVNSNVTDLASAKSVLSKLAMIVAYLARERLSDVE